MEDRKEEPSQVKNPLKEEPIAKILLQHGVNDEKLLLGITEDDMATMKLDIGQKATIRLWKQVQTAPQASQDPVAHLGTVEEKYQYLCDEILGKRVQVQRPLPLYRPDRQAELLKEFNNPKIQLPFSGLSFDFRLLGFDNTPKSEATKIMIDSLSSLRSWTETYHAVCLGVSGCGKTRSLFDIATQHYVIYFECVPSTDERIDPTRDKNFGALVNDLRLCASENASLQFRTKAEQRILIEILSRLLYLRGLFKQDPKTSPRDFLLGQLNGGQNTISGLVSNLRTISLQTARDLIAMVVADLQQFIQDARLVAVLDEANLAMNELYGKWESPHQHPRGLLTGITQAFKTTPGLSISLIYAGTSLRMLTAESIQSDIGKHNQLAKITNYKPSTDTEPREWLEKNFDLTGCEKVWQDSSVSTRELVGRKRLLTGVPLELSDIQTRMSKEQTLDKAAKFALAVSATVENARKKMFDRLLGFARSRKDVKESAERLVVATLLTQGSLRYFPSPEEEAERDFVHLGICQLAQDPAGKPIWKLAEPLAMRVVNEVLDSLGQGTARTVLSSARRSLYKLVSLRSSKASERGFLFQHVIAAQLLCTEWQGNRISKLPFLDTAAKLPAWMSRVDYKAIRYGTAQELGFTDDLHFLERFVAGTPNTTNVVLIPESAMRVDGLLFLRDGSSCYAITFASAIYSSPVPKRKWRSNRISLDLRKFYFTRDGNQVNPKAKAKRDRYEKIMLQLEENLSLGGTLGINFVLPRVAGQNVDNWTVNNDCILDITEVNMMHFFPDNETRALISAVLFSNIQRSSIQRK